jgi:hypothetical protein
VITATLYPPVNPAQLADMPVSDTLTAYPRNSRGEQWSVVRCEPTQWQAWRGGRLIVGGIEAVVRFMEADHAE